MIFISSVKRSDPVPFAISSVVSFQYSILMNNVNWEWYSAGLVVFCRKKGTISSFRRRMISIVSYNPLDESYSIHHLLIKSNQSMTVQLLTMSYSYQQNPIVS